MGPVKKKRRTTMKDEEGQKRSTEREMEMKGSKGKKGKKEKREWRKGKRRRKTKGEKKRKKT